MTAMVTLPRWRLLQLMRRARQGSDVPSRIAPTEDLHAGGSTSAEGDREVTSGECAQEQKRASKVVAGADVPPVVKRPNSPKSPRQGRDQDRGMVEVAPHQFVNRRFLEREGLI